MNEKSDLQVRIDSGTQILIAELSPPKSGDPELVTERAKVYAGKVHALGVSDNRDGAAMSALAAASLVASRGVEPIPHMVTRDRNRIALVSECGWQLIYDHAKAIGMLDKLEAIATP